MRSPRTVDLVAGRILMRVSTPFAGRSVVAAVSTPYRAYMLVVLMLIYVFNGVDRSIMWVLLEPIKTDLHLTDSQLGWLSGFAFGVFYALAGVPIGLLADRYERRRIIAAAVAVWSLLTAVCGVAAGFWQLFGARVAVGAAEAGAPPASISFISDLYSERSQTAAIAAYMSASSLALVLTYAAGGWVGSHLGWRAGFLAAGLPGLLLAVLVWLTLREPMRRSVSGIAVVSPPPRLRTTLRCLWSSPSIRWMLLGVTISSIPSVGVSTFLASFLIRSYHLSLAQAGGLIALCHAFAALVIVLIGRSADRLKSRDLRWLAWLPALIVIAGVALACIVFTAGSLREVYAALPLLCAVGGGQAGPVFSFMQTHVKPQMKATSMSIAYGAQNLIGIGLGALLVGVISDHLARRFGTEALRYAMAIVAGVYLIAAGCYLQAARKLKELAES